GDKNPRSVRAASGRMSAPMSARSAGLLPPDPLSSPGLLSPPSLRSPPSLLSQQSLLSPPSLLSQQSLLSPPSFLSPRTLAVGAGCVTAGFRQAGEDALDLDCIAALLGGVDRAPVGPHHLGDVTLAALAPLDLQCGNARLI